MPVTLDEILGALCSEVKPLAKSGEQVSFSLNTQKEAQLVYDILAAHGYDVRIYHEENQSKLYVNHPAEISAEKLDAALSHAQMLRQILGTIENTAATDYHISFANTPDKGKQLSVFFPSQQQSEQPLLTPKQDNFQRPAAQPRQAPVTSPRSALGWKIRKRAAFMAAGPTVAKNKVFVSRGVKGWLHNYFVSHVAESFLAFCSIFFLAIFTLSIIVTAKGYICPDLATVKSRAWYCNVSILPRNDENQ